MLEKWRNICNMKKIFIISLILSLFSAVLSAEETSPSDLLLFKSANELFEKANRTALKDSELSKKLYEEAALKYQLLIDGRHVATAPVFMDLGNAFYFSGDKGRALLNYYRAALIDPSDDDIQHNLAFVRSECVDEIDSSLTERILRKVLFFHFFKFKTRVILFFISYSLFWGILTIMLFKKMKKLRITALVMLLFSILFASSLTVSYLNLFSSVDGVVIAKEAQAYQGDGYIYSPAFATPLHAGTEFKLEDLRGEWAHIRLRDQSRCWIPAKDIELIGDL